ncbi:MAG: hypothetical protein WAM70_19800, partial [Pyrinomonadaceae bacterium]
LFATPIGKGLTDHDYRPQDGIGWKYSLEQIRSVFTTANHICELPRTSRPKTGCYNTWKALFYLGGTADVHNRIGTFLSGWREYEGSDSYARRDLADRAIECKECFGAAIEFLISEEMYVNVGPKIVVSDYTIDLPSRPGIRFLIALCRFIVDVESNVSPENTQILKIEFKASSVIIDFDKPRLLERIWEKKKHEIPNFVHTTGIFMHLEDCTIVPPKGKRDYWSEFLNDPKFASTLTLVPENDWQRLVISWQI